MHIVLHKNFIKKYKKLSPKVQEKFKERRDIFLENPFNPILNNHALHGEYSWVRSIDITGDYRVHYQKIATDTVLFRIIGTHHELYGS